MVWHLHAKLSIQVVSPKDNARFIISDLILTYNDTSISHARLPTAPVRRRGYSIVDAAGGSAMWVLAAHSAYGRRLPSSCPVNSRSV